MSTSVIDSTDSLNSRHLAAGRLGVAWSIGLGLCAAWLAAGSLGTLTTSLQATLSWLLLGAAVLCAQPRLKPGGWCVLAGAILVLAAVPAIVAPVRQGLTLTVAAVMGGMAAGLVDPARRLMLAGAVAVLTLAVYRLAQQSVPAIWMLSDALGGLMGYVAAGALRRPLAVGASFGGLDLVIVMGVFCALWVRALRGPRLASALFAVGAIGAVHFLYLTILACTPEILSRLPPVEPPAMGNPYVPPPFSWLLVVRQLLPWNLPALAALLYLVLVVVLIRTGVYRVDSPELAMSAGRRDAGWRAVVILLGLALILPWCGLFRTGQSLAGKRIVANMHGQLDWETPQHDEYGREQAGMYGMLPSFVASLGAELQLSSDLSSADLASADAVLLLNPDTELSLEQQDRVWQYVRDGGSMLVVTEGFLPENGLERRVNELLQPTSISVHRDAAMSETTDWWGSIRALEHPAMTSVYPAARRVFSDLGASVEVRWPARPLALGIWGWSAPEQGATLMGAASLLPGARLGDLVLAAEQRVGAGRVLVLGDRYSLTNEGLVNGHTFVADLLSYLAAPTSGPQAMWRQFGTVLCLAGLLGLVAWHISGPRLMATCVLLASSLALAQLVIASSSSVMPDGTQRLAGAVHTPPNRVAYIDATHLEPYSVRDWSFDALNGLVLNLARNGYLPLALHEFDAARLERAGLFVSIGPARAFSSAERACLRQFVQRGGILISMVGAEEAAASAALLADFGLRVPPSPVPTCGTDFEPEPFGRTRANYLEVSQEADSYLVAARLHAAWPVEPQVQEAEVLAYGHNQLPVVQSEAELPVIVTCRFGQGQVVLIGDTCFAMNKNLEYIGGEPFHGAYENAHFWRWLLTRLQGQPEWVPPRPPARVQEPDDEAAEVAPEEDMPEEEMFQEEAPEEEAPEEEAPEEEA